MWRTSIGNNKQKAIVYKSYLKIANKQNLQIQR